jgi:hypothetical protein
MVMDNGIDDKCPNCGEWTRRAFEYYGGFYNGGPYHGGDEMDYCTCDYQGEEDEPTSERGSALAA